MWLWKFAGCKGAMLKEERKRTWNFSLLHCWNCTFAPLNFLNLFSGSVWLWKFAGCESAMLKGLYYHIFHPNCLNCRFHFWIFSICLGFWIRVIVGSQNWGPKPVWFLQTRASSPGVGKIWLCSNTWAPTSIATSQVQVLLLAAWTWTPA